MVQAVEVSLTTSELASALVLCGYESMANQMLELLDLSQDEQEFDRFIKQTEVSLKMKGYFDENRSSVLVKELEDLIHLLVHSKKKIRCVRGNTVSFMHKVNEKNILIQKVENNIHSFTHIGMGQGYEIYLEEFIGLGKKSVDPVNDLTSLLLTSELFDYLHHIDNATLEDWLNNEKLDVELLLFLKDFKLNNQEFDNISYMEMDFVKDYSKIDDVQFFLISEHFIWYLDYDKIEDDEIFVVPSDLQSYRSSLSASFSGFFEK